jgi:serine protease AprX
MCLSTMASNKPGTMIGTAPKAFYWLLKTEDTYAETISEEYNWIRGAEFADSVGADITTTSLGYSTFDGSLNNHTYADLNGKTAPMSIAATMAARKGIIVLNAAGNEGANPWHYITVPSDADSIIAVGAVNSSYAKASFSGFGPSADGRIKPDLCALGQGATVYDPSGFVNTGGNGTSFATPILAGATACLWQYASTAKNMQIIGALKASATNSASPNNLIGWGVPKLCTAMSATNVGVSELKDEAGQVSIYPNPFNSEIKIKLSNTSSFVTVVINDVLGKTVYSERIENPSEIISISKLNEVNGGVYFISISSPTFNINKKIVKQ